MPQPPGERRTLGREESGASDELRTAVGGMEAGGEDMDKG